MTGYKMDQKTVQQFFKRVNTVTMGPSDPTPECTPKKLKHVHTRACSQMPIAVFSRTQLRKSTHNSKCPSADEWINKTRNIPTVE